MARIPGFIGPSYIAASINVECQRSINLYPDIDQTGFIKDVDPAALRVNPDYSLVGTPGLIKVCDTPNGQVVRGSYTATDGNWYYVAGNLLYTADSSFVATVLGTLNTSTGRVSFSDNGTQLILVDGPNGYIYNFNTFVFGNITSLNFLGSSFVMFLDGYFIHVRPNTSVYYISALYDGYTYNALMYNTVTRTSSKLNAAIINQKQLWLFSTQGVELHYDSGAAMFPIEPISGSFMEHGCAAPYTVCKINGLVLWLGQDKSSIAVVWESNGTEPVRVSTSSIERIIQNSTIQPNYVQFSDATSTHFTTIDGYNFKVKSSYVTTLSQATAYIYSKNGCDFYVLNLTSGTTLVYEINTKLWHERASQAVYAPNGWSATPDSDGLARHRGALFTNVYSQYILTDYATSAIYAMSDTQYTDNGAPISRIRVSQHISSDLKYVFYKSMQLDMETGVGNITVTNPTASLQWSNDAGHTFNAPVQAAIGINANYTARVIWRRLGKARDRVLKVVITDPVKVVLTGLNSNMSGGTV